MDIVRVTPDPIVPLPRAPLERERRAVRGADGRGPDEASRERPVCAASSSQLVLDLGSGAAWSCRAASKPFREDLFSTNGQGAIEVWGAASRCGLADAHRRGELPRDHCGRCAAMLGDGLFAQSAILREGERLPGAGTTGSAQRPDGLRALVLVVSPAAETSPGPGALLESLVGALAGLERLEFVGDEPLADERVRTILGHLQGQPAARRPSIGLTAGRLPDYHVAAGLLEGLDVVRMRVEVPHGVADGDPVWTERLRSTLRVARRLVADGAGLELSFVLTPADWFGIEHVALLARESEAELLLRLRDERPSQDPDRVTEAPLATLPLRQLHYVHVFLQGCWGMFSGDRRIASLSQNAFSELMQELRELIARRARDSRWNGSTEALAPEHGGVLTLPPIGHPWSVRESTGRLLLQAAGGLTTASEALAAWCSRRPIADLIAAARVHVWTRLLIERLAADGSETEAGRLASGALRRIFVGANAAQRRAMVEEDLDFADEIGLRGAVEYWHEWLGLERIAARMAPFDVDVVPAPKAPAVETEEPRKKAIGKKATRKKAGAKKTGAGQADDESSIQVVETAAQVTVLVPSYRHERYIERTIESVLAQRGGVRFELLVVDDRSPDQTVERARRFESDPRVTVRENDTNLGLGNSVLAALETIETPYVALLNSDDLFHPDRLVRSLEALEASPAAEVVTTGLFLVDHKDREITGDGSSRLVDGREIHEWVQWYLGAQPVEDDELGLFRRLLRGNFLATSSNLVCTTEFLRAHADAFRSLKYTLDWRIFLDAARRGTLVHIPDRLVAYRLHRTNTVWFREGRRWSYYVEVNRVAASEVRALLADAGEDRETRLDILRLIAEDLSRNAELHGMAMFANELFGGVALDAISEDGRGADRLRQLAENGAHQSRLQYLWREHGEQLEKKVRATYELPSLQVHKVLAEVEASEVSSLRDEHVADAQRALEDEAKIEGLVRQVEAAERRAREAGEEREEARARADEFMHRLFALGSRLRERAKLIGDAGAGAELPAELPPETHPEDVSDLLGSAANALIAESRRRAQERDGARAALEGSQRQVDWERDRHADSVRTLEGSLAETRDELEQRDNELRTSEGELESARDTVRMTADELASVRTDLQRERDERRREMAEAVEVHQRLESELADSKSAAEDAWSRLAERTTQHEQEMARLLNSRPYRVGKALSSIPGSGRAARFASRMLRFTRNFGDRTVSFFQRLFGRPRERRKAVVAACFDFPIYSHTFVYQEMIGLREAGFDVELFCWRKNDTSKMHAAFSYLLDNCRVLETTWDKHVEDRDYWQRKEPEKVAALFERLSSEMGLPVDKLQNDYEILMAFTFAREVEKTGAEYLHSYFFYEESFFAMVTSILLEIPRGVSCYADHMMEDSRFKTMSLQMDTADVVVATSRRIKKELLELTDVRFDDRILVKPNGVDGRRFPFAERPAFDGTLELLSVSRIEPKKGFIELCRTAKELKDAGKSVRFHIVGTPDAATAGGTTYGERFEAERKRLGVEDCFVMHGFMRQEEMAPLIAKCHSFVAPYVEVENGDKDGIPTAILEAMSSGLGILCSDAGSIPEIVDDGVEGFMVLQRDASAMAAILARVHDEPEWIGKLGRAARARFETEFDARVTDAKLHQRVKQVLSRRIASAV